MIVWLAATLLSGAGFFLSLGLGTHWYLAWIAPVPVLWYAFSGKRAASSFLAAFVSYALGASNLLIAYGSVMPVAVLAQILFGPALIFGLTVMLSRKVHLRLGAIAGVLAFAAGFAATDFLISFAPAGGAVSSPANSQIDVPIMAQSAALGGFAAVTFLIGLVAAALAEGARRRSLAWLLAATAIFTANAGLGAWRMTGQSQGSVRVALMGSNNLAANTDALDEARTGQIFAAYAKAIRALAGKHVAVVLLPENSTRLGPEWAQAALAPVDAAAREIGAIALVGYNGDFAGARRNLVTAVGADARNATYAKRHLVVGLETPDFTPGTTSLTLPGGVMPEICKDMDFQATIRKDAAANHPMMFAVPAWDFGRDAWAHARPAILRSIETGTPLARSARDGLLTLNDRYGRVLVKQPVREGLTVAIGDLPVAGRGGETLYARVGDAFAWVCLAVTLGLAIMAMTIRRPSCELASART
ncbi:apolipoprotein N-acyltransferase [Novosphingobium sp. PhB165]|uniref:hypothetical protein n=1 Tax=Novosphingobium sp. PhB165 TaxID=2485105 RepID=UPI001053C3D2|nr:hypothetical protein [Novosphingobium sp. PhB165]TCM16452.1 apolipoprotein N-acyltransferase [Novosphingobium sp. PhB165]